MIDVWWFQAVATSCSVMLNNHLCQQAQGARRQITSVHKDHVRCCSAHVLRGHFYIQRTCAVCLAARASGKHLAVTTSSALKCCAVMWPYVAAIVSHVQHMWLHLDSVAHTACTAVLPHTVLAVPCSQLCSSAC
jgi:hypothetical protein